MPVGVVERLRHLSRDAERLLDGELFPAFDVLAQRLPSM
jgi:hypothetical protein